MIPEYHLTKRTLNTGDSGRLSQSVDESNQGKLQGVNQSLQSAYQVIVPITAGAIYFYSPSVLYGIATLIAAGTLVMFSQLKPQ